MGLGNRFALTMRFSVLLETPTSSLTSFTFNKRSSLTFNWNLLGILESYGQGEACSLLTG